MRTKYVWKIGISFRFANMAVLIHTASYSNTLIEHISHFGEDR
jgi:hypothetical protein